ncbi:hypothetical protein SAY86_011740 [Trapa natans]|uniref:Protein kinase domain-containing protein n=1 Tax=Trapa natans TaxID=22666 RepID=A0AAN7R325_TRANT|nr:hypothetical protein SAY86_011740 [Trapa natans]
MGVRWNPLGFRLPCYLALIILVSQIQGYCTVNPEGQALLEFKAGIYLDPYGALANWNPNQNDPCRWSGVKCISGEIYILDLSGFSLEGILSPELGKLSHLRSLLLDNNRFFGSIPKELGNLNKLELLHLRNNNLSGRIPPELGRLLSLKSLLLCGNTLEGSIPLELDGLSLLSELQFDENIKSSSFSVELGCTSRKSRHCNWQSIMKQQKNVEAWNSKASCCVNIAAQSLQCEPTVNILRRKLLEQSSNIEVPPASTGYTQVSSILVTRSSGAFPAVPGGSRVDQTNPSPPPGESGNNTVSVDQKPTQNQSTSSGSWKYIVIIASSIVVLCLVALGICFVCRKKGAKTITPWKTGISGQLQKAFVTGVPKLNRTELETACEEFSNIISTLDGSIVYKGTLSSGVEIAVTSTTVSALKDWAPNVEKAYRKRIDTLSRVNHKNFVNLIGYCEEDEPFTRMMVFEYAPSGTLFEHLHVKEAEHLDWNARVRIIMGIAYCLQYMHHEINPPVAHSSLNSDAIFLTDDYAAKVAEVNIWSGSSSKSHDEEDKSRNSVLPPMADPETNVYDFGMLLLEIISGKLPHSEEHGSLIDWATEYLDKKQTITQLVDPSLKSYKDNELELICEIIQDCIKLEPRQRLTMKEVTSKLREVIAITPDQATPRLSPLWWAELEILSVETT